VVRELRSDGRQLRFQLTDTGIAASEGLLELLGSRLLGRNYAIELADAPGSAFRLGAEAAPLLALLRQLLLQPRGRSLSPRLAQPGRPRRDRHGREVDRSRRRRA